MKHTFSKIAVFQYSTEAHIIKSRLEAEGIEAFLFDQFTVDTDPLVSHAIGGVKLKVWAEDEERALQILNSIPDYAVDDRGHEIICDVCGSHKVELVPSVKGAKSLLAFLFSFFTTTLPVYGKHEYRCQNCKQTNLNE